MSDPSDECMNCGSSGRDRWEYKEVCPTCRGTGRPPTDRCCWCGADLPDPPHKYDGYYLCYSCAEMRYDSSCAPNNSAYPNKEYKDADCVYFSKSWVNFNAEEYTPDYGWATRCDHPDKKHGSAFDRGCSDSEIYPCELRRTVPLRPVLCRNELRFDHYTSCPFFAASAVLMGTLPPTIAEMMDECRFRCAAKKEGDAP